MNSRLPRQPRSRLVVLAVLCALAGEFSFANGDLLTADSAADVVTGAAQEAPREGNPLIAAARSGDPEAQERLGVLLRRGESGFERDERAARDWLERAAQAKRAVAAATLAEMLRDGVGGPKDPVRARHLFSMAAMQGDAQGLAALAHDHWLRDTEGDRREAIRLLTVAAAQGHAYSLGFLSYAYTYGLGVPRDPERALELLLRAAELGDPDAQVAAPALLFARAPAPEPVRRGRALLERAANEGNVEAMYALGYHYWRGRQLPRDGALATRWLAAAVQRGHTHAALWLAQCYASGFGTARNPARAELLFVAAQNTATADAQNTLAWELAVDPQAELRDGLRAVKLMENLLEEPVNRTAQYLDTLAAAYAEAGRHADAVKAQLEAIGRIGALRVDAQTRGGFDARLALYRARQAYRESP